MSAINISPDTVEQYRESAFVGVLFLGALIFAVGGAFLVIGISVNTEPPAPYVTPSAKQILIAGSLVAVVIGGFLVRFAARVVGW